MSCKAQWPGHLLEEARRGTCDFSDGLVRDGGGRVEGRGRTRVWIGVGEGALTLPLLCHLSQLLLSSLDSESPENGALHSLIDSIPLSHKYRNRI